MSSEPPPPTPEVVEGPAPKRAQLDRGRLARWVALGGVLAVVLATKTMVIPQVPEDHEVEVRLDTPRDVVGVDMRWSAPGGGDDIITTSLHFPAGTAPSSVRTRVHLPDGPYEVAIAVERVSGVDSTRRRITLDGGASVTIPLR